MWVCVLSESGLLVCTSGSEVILHGFGRILVKKMAVVGAIFQRD